MLKEGDKVQYNDGREYIHFGYSNYLAENIELRIIKASENNEIFKVAVIRNNEYIGWEIAFSHELKLVEKKPIEAINYIILEE